MAANSIESIYSNYMKLTAESGEKPGNTDGIKSIEYANGELLFEENDGDNIKVSVGNISDETISQLNERFGVTISNKASTETATSKDSTAASVDGKTSAKDTEEGKKAEKKPSDSEIIAQDRAKISEAQAKRSTIEAQKAAKSNELSSIKNMTDGIKSHVEELSGEIEKELNEFMKNEEKLAQEEQTRIQNAVQKEIDQYKQDKENGKPVTMGTLSARIQTALQGSNIDAEMQNLISGLVVTNAKMKEMDELLDQLGSIGDTISDLESEIGKLDEQIGDIDKEISDANKDIKKHDPIGFTSGNITYEFVVDKDNSGDLTDVSEFLGATNNFDEMKSLDKDTSGNVDKNELATAGVKVLVTDKANGTQELKDINEVFGEKDLSIDTENYQDLKGQNKTADNGQELLGNFNVTLGEETITGYSTLDTEDYLKENYKFSAENAENAPAVPDENENFLTEYSAKLKEYEEKFQQVLDTLGLNQDLSAQINEIGSIVGVAEAKQYLEELDKAEKAKKAEEEKAAENNEEETAAPAENTNDADGEAVDEDADTAEIEEEVDNEDKDEDEDEDEE